MNKKTPKDQTRRNRPPRETPESIPKTGNEKGKSTASRDSGNKPGERRYSGTDLPVVEEDQ